MLNGMALARIPTCGSIQVGSLSHVPTFGYVHFVCLFYFFTDAGLLQITWVRAQLRDTLARVIRDDFMAGATVTSETNIVPIRALSDDDALAWIVGKGKVETSAAALARDWLWSPSKVRRRLASWSSAGLIKVKPGLGGRTVITTVAEPVAASPAGRRGRAVVKSVPEPVAVRADDAATETAIDHLPSTVDPSSSTVEVPAVDIPAAVDRHARARATGLINVLAYAVAVALAGIAAYF